MTELVGPAAESYAALHTTPFAATVEDATAWTRENTSRPQMMSGLIEARLLEALIVAGSARWVLEIGTFTGVGALTMAAALPEGGRLTTLEIDPETAAAAARHFKASPVGDRIELLVGDALELIAGLPGPFDLVYIDAWKADYPAYYEAVVPKLAERGVIVADNVFRSGDVLDPEASDPDTAGVRTFADRVAHDDRVHNVVLTIGDGVMLAWNAASPA